MTNRQRIQLLAAIITGVGLRAAWALVVPVIPVSDSAAYDAFARTLSEHGVFGWIKEEPFAFWPPGTTFLHGALYWLFGQSYAALVSANIAISAGIIWTSARVADRLFCPRAAVATAWVIALWPTLIIYVTIIASELLFVLLITAALDAWTIQKSPRPSTAVLAGALLGAAALVRPLALLLPLIYGLAWAVTKSESSVHLRQHLASVGVALVAMACIVAPWTYRNYQLYGELVLISTNGGITFWMGHTPGTDGSYMYVPEDVSHLRDNEQEKVLKARAWTYIREAPGEFLLRTVRKFVKLYSNESIGVVWNAPGIGKAFGNHAIVPMKRATQISWGLLFVFALIGAWSLARELGSRALLFSPLTLSIAYFSAVYSLTVSQDRYHLSFASMLAVFMGAGVLVLLDILLSSGARKGLRRLTLGQNSDAAGN